MLGDSTDTITCLAPNSNECYRLRASSGSTADSKKTWTGEHSQIALIGHQAWVYILTLFPIAVLKDAKDRDGLHAFLMGCLNPSNVDKSEQWVLSTMIGMLVQFGYTPFEHVLSYGVNQRNTMVT